MNFLRSTPIFKTIFLSVMFAVIQWPGLSEAFKAHPSGEFYDKTLTHQGLKDLTVQIKSTNPKKTIGFSDTAILEIQNAVRGVGSDHELLIPGDSELKDGELHCSNEQLLACSARILKYRKEIVAALADQPLLENAGPVVWQALGKALHTVQDYYSHSNWVERGNTSSINPYLLGDPDQAGGLLPAGELPPKPNAAVVPACQPKSGGGSEILNLGTYPTSGYSLRGNICNVTAAHSGRCVHGCTGPLCEQAPDSTCAGMNKDTPDELGGHAQGRHQTAAVLAVNATSAFVSQIIEEVQSQPGINQTQKDQALCAMMDSPACTSAGPNSIIPGMVGPGMTTPAGSGPNRSGGQIIHVTNLNASGPGSLLAAIKASGPRIIVFDVSGYIDLQDEIFISEPYLTIAGQTAPYPGITLKGAGFEIRSHDILIQHIRIRVGDNPNGPNPGSRDSLTILGSKKGEEPSYNIVVDHVSMSWSLDENMSTWYEGINNVTLANSIVSEALSNSIHPEGEHSKAFLVGPTTRSLLVIGNLFAHNNDRNIRLHGDTSTLFVNNLVYNWGVASTGFGTKDSPKVLEASVVGNVYLRGPDTKSTSPIKLHKETIAGSKVYVADNQAVETSSDPWSVVKLSGSLNEADFRVDSPPNWVPSLTPVKGNETKNWVLNNAGARRADGDAIDSRIIKDVINETGRIIDSQNDVGGWVPLVENTRGIGGIPQLKIPNNPNEIQASGYTKVEEWLHALAKQVEISKPTQ